MTQVDLKPCPFCGGSASFQPRAFKVCCDSCGATRPCGGLISAEHVSAWNTRAATKADAAQVPEVKALWEYYYATKSVDDEGLIFSTDEMFARLETARAEVAKLTAERDALDKACAEWSETSQANYQRALRAENLLSDIDATITTHDAAKVLLAQWYEHGDGPLGDLVSYSQSADGELSPDIDGDWIRFSDVCSALRAAVGANSNDRR